VKRRIQTDKFFRLLHFGLPFGGFVRAGSGNDFSAPPFPSYGPDLIDEAIRRYAIPQKSKSNDFA
jgi:hypothetical protein